MVSSRESLSEQSRKRTNMILLVVGIILALLFLMVWCQMQPEENQAPLEEISGGFGYVPPTRPGEETPEVSEFSTGDALLLVSPKEVVMTPNVVIGSTAETVVTLRAVNGSIILEKIGLQREQEEGFVLSGSCLERGGTLVVDEECLLVVSWHPTSLRQIENNIVIDWRDSNPNVFDSQKTMIPVKAQSTDSKDCCVCCDKKDQEEKPSKPDPIGTDGNPRKPEEGDKTTDEGIVTDKNDKPVGFDVPKKAALSLKNEWLGEISESGNVVDENGKKIGRLLTDNTIIDDDFKVVGKAIYLTPAMDEKGRLLGRVIVNRSSKAVEVVDANQKVIGYPRVDGQIEDVNHNPIGFSSPWGAVVDSVGNYLGMVLPAGDTSVVLGKENEVVGVMRPMGLALNDKGELIGGTIRPFDVAVKAGGEALGTVSLNGRVLDSVGEVAGHVLLDGSVVNAQMEELGAVIRPGLIIDSDGKAIGRVNSVGAVTALNAKATQIGVVNPDGSVFFKKKYVGTVMPEGQVISGPCAQVGSVYPDGSVVNWALNKVGNITPTGEAINDKNRIIGKIAPKGTAIAKECRLLGLISLNGNLVSVDGETIGCVDPDRSVQNLQGQTVGEVTPLGIYVKDGKVIGRVRLDGHVMNNQGEIIGCVNSPIPPLPDPRIDETIRGVIVDANGYPMGSAFRGVQAFDEQENWLGDVQFNGWVIGDKGRLAGVVPQTGTVFSDDGRIVGSYSQKTGLLNGPIGKNFGRVLPGLTVINQTGTEVLGRLIPEGTTFMGIDGNFLGKLTYDGQIKKTDDSILSGKILANGTVVDKDGILLGAALPTGPVLSSQGSYVGMANKQGEVLDGRGETVGRTLPNGLVVSAQKKVIGQVFPMLSSAISARGFLGTLSPKVMTVADKLIYQGQISDRRGNLVGTLSGTGVVLGVDNSVVGRMVPLDVFVNAEGKLVGWANFSGEVNNSEGRMIGSILPFGGMLDKSFEISAMVVQRAVAVNTTGGYLGRLSTHGEVLSNKGEKIAVVGTTPYLYDVNGAIIGQILNPGIAVDMNGAFLGWTRFDGQIENGEKIIGQVGLDGHVFDNSGMMVGRYMPLGNEVFNDDGKSVGFVAHSAEVTEASGVTVGGIASAPYVTSNGVIVGRLLGKSDFANSTESGTSLGVADASGVVQDLKMDKEIGKILMNRYFIRSSGDIDGGMVPTGVALAPTLGIVGSQTIEGNIEKSKKKQAITTGTGLVYSLSGDLMGGIFEPSVVIDKKGVFAGVTSGMSAVVMSGQQVGNKMAFQSVLSQANEWVGNALPTGSVVNDDGVSLGVIQSDGSVLGARNAFVGRALPDGSVAGVPEKAVFNTMPYLGHTVAQGLPLSYEKKVMGYTSVMGDVVDKSGQKIFRILDDDTILGKAERPLMGVILPLVSATDHKGNVMGTLTGSGYVVSFKGKKQGFVANNGTIKGEGKFDVLGALVPEPLVVNDCKMVGQTAYDGRVVNGQGSVVGRMGTDLWAVDTNGNKIGRVVRNGPVMTEDGQYLGRTLPNSRVVDVQGVEFACALNDGTVLGDDGQKKGAVVERGPVFDKDGNMVARVNSKGDVLDVKNTKLGTVAGDGKNTILGLDGQPVDGWWMATKNQELVLDPKGNLELTIDRGDGWKVRNEGGEDLGHLEFREPGEPPQFRPAGGGSASDTINPCMADLGCLKNCKLYDAQDKAVGILSADGVLRDEVGNALATLKSDGTVYHPDGTVWGKFLGINVSDSLKQCGVSGGLKTKTKIKIHDREYDVRDNIVYDDDDVAIGLWQDGRIVKFDGQEVKAEDLIPKEPVILPWRPNPSDIEPTVDAVKKRRQTMHEGLGKGILTISKELEARARVKKDKDWSRVGVKKEVISSYPVDMSHVILQGKAIPAVLERSIDSRYASDAPAVAVVERNIYAEDGRNILIPAGSRLIGTCTDGAGKKKRVAKVQISWSRLIRPDGVAFNLEDAGAKSGDAQGRGGIAAYLDEQMLKKYSKPIATAGMTSAILYFMGDEDEESTSNSNGQSTTSKKSKGSQARENFKEAMEKITDQMIDDAYESEQILFVPSGTRLTVFAKKDLWLRTEEEDIDEANEKYGEPSREALTPKDIVGSWTEQRKKEIEGNDESPEEGTPSESEEKSPAEEPLYDGTNPDLQDRVIPRGGQQAVQY